MKATILSYIVTLLIIFVLVHEQMSATDAILVALTYTSVSYIAVYCLAVIIGFVIPYFRSKQ